MGFPLSLGLFANQHPLKGCCTHMVPPPSPTIGSYARPPSPRAPSKLHGLGMTECETYHRRQ